MRTFMKALIKTLFLLYILVFSVSTGLANEIEGKSERKMEALCLPGPYFENPQDDCLVLGAAEYQTERQEIQASIDTIPERFISGPEELGDTTTRYIRLDSENDLNYYYSLERAIFSEVSDGNFRPGYTFAAFESVNEIDGETYYLLTDDTWINGTDVIKEVYPTPFRGVLMNGTTPIRPFGWVVSARLTHVTPGWDSPTSDRMLNRYEFVEVYETETIYGFDWYRIGPDEWVEQRALGLVFPNNTPPTGVENGRWIELNLFEQTTAVYDNEELVFATLTTSGSDAYYTRPGLFKVYSRFEITSMAGGVEADKSDQYYLQGIPWVLYFDDGRGFHGEYWHDHLGYQSSHGCANLSFADSEWLFDWAELGDWVYVWDPSGDTPVDEYLFTHLIDD